MSTKKLTKCRFCGSSNLEPFLDLGKIPLVNNVLVQPGKAPTYPLKALVCKDCTMGQLDTIVDPELMYSNYTYRSGMSNEFTKHCRKLVQEIEKVYPEDTLIIDIAGNDGTLLSQFDKKKYNLLNIEPATNIAALSSQKNIKTWNLYFDHQVVSAIKQMYGLFVKKVIIAQNVFTHVDDVTGFMENCVRLMDNDSVLIIEVPYFLDILQNTEFDLFYHEHLSYISFTGMLEFVHKFGLEITEYKHFNNIHGSTIRFYIKLKSSLKFVNLIESNNKKKQYEKEDVLKFADVFNDDTEDLKNNLLTIINKGQVSGVGASAKGCVLCNYLGLTEKEINVIYDTTPNKVGRFQPGTNIPIVNFEDVYKEKNPLLILAWNWSKEIKKKILAVNDKARFIVPLPYLESDI